MRPGTATRAPAAGCELHRFPQRRDRFGGMTRHVARHPEIQLQAAIAGPGGDQFAVDCGRLIEARSLHGRGTTARAGGQRVCASARVLRTPIVVSSIVRRLRDASWRIRPGLPSALPQRHDAVGVDYR